MSVAFVANVDVWRYNGIGEARMMYLDRYSFAVAGLRYDVLEWVSTLKGWAERSDIVSCRMFVRGVGLWSEQEVIATSMYILIAARLEGSKRVTP